LARGPLLTELLLHCGERDSLVRQGRPQPIGLLGLLLSLTLPGPRPLEGRAVLLEQGVSGGYPRPPTPPRWCAPPPDLPAPCAARRHAPPAPFSPSRPWRRPPRPGRPAPEAGPAEPRPGTPTTGLETSGPEPRYQLRSASRRSRVLYLSRARRSKSCRRRARREKTGVREGTNAEESERKNHETRQKI
jgi:hypothetical protein